MNQRVPVLVMNQNAKRDVGRSASLSIINAAKAVADIIRSTLGPRAMLKMLLSSNGSITLTNDGHCILREIDVDHPAAKSIIELSRTQDEQVGDGTTSVIILAGELLHLARPFVADGIHPSKILSAYARAEDEFLSHLETLKTKIDVEDKAKLIELANVSLGTKFVSRFGNFLPQLAYEAAMIAKRKGDGIDMKNTIKVEKVPGGEITESQVIKGVMLSKDILHSAMRRKIENPKILILNSPLEYKKAESETNLEITKAEDWRKYLDAEEDYIRKICAQIRSTGADIVLTEKGASDMAIHFLMSANITVLRRVRRTDLQRLSLACGAKNSDLYSDISPSHLGNKCKLFEVRKIGDDYWSFFEKCDDAKACTILLRGASKDVLSEIERNLIDSLGVLKNLLVEPYIVPGGGAVEMALSSHLRSIADKLSKDEKLHLEAIHSACAAVESIPRVLLENSGAKVSRVMSELRSIHEEGKMENVKIGIDGSKGTIASADDTKVWEPVLVKRKSIKTAFESTAMLLRIDDILSGVSKGKRDGNQMGNQQQAMVG